MPKKKVIHPVPVHHEEVVVPVAEVVAIPTPIVEHPTITSLRQEHASLSPGEKGGQKGKFIQFQFLKATKALRTEVTPLTL